MAKKKKDKNQNITYMQYFLCINKYIMKREGDDDDGCV